MQYLRQCHKPVLACKQPRCIRRDIGPTLEIYVPSGLTIAMVPSLCKNNVHFERKLSRRRAQKCNTCARVKIKQTCTGLQTTMHVAFSAVQGRQWKNALFLGLSIAMVPCLHQSNVHIKRTRWRRRAQKYNPCVSPKSEQACTGLQTTPSHAAQYRADIGNLRNFGDTYRHNSVFAPKQCAHQKEATGMERRTRPTIEIWRNLGLPISMVPPLHQTNVYIKRKLRVWKA